MNFSKSNSEQNSNQIMKLTSIFSILFVSIFYMTIILTEDKGLANVKSISRVQVPISESSSTMVSDVEPKDLTVQSHESLDESKITMQSGTASSISNYINAWKLSKANSVF
jgi:hypothetical protein